MTSMSQLRFGRATAGGAPIIRNARPEDSLFLAWAVVSAARSHLSVGTWDLVLQTTARDRLEVLEWMVLDDTPSMFHFSRFLIAEVDGEPAAALAGYDPGVPGFMRAGGVLARAFDELGFPEEELKGTFERLAGFEQTAPPEPEGTWIVEWVHTRPRHRRKGLATRLLRKILDRGRRNGCQQAQISFIIGNDSALNAYRRLGFEVEDEYRFPEFAELFGAPGMVRMTRSLTGG